MAQEQEQVPVQKAELSDPETITIQVKGFSKKQNNSSQTKLAAYLAQTVLLLRDRDNKTESVTLRGDQFSVPTCLLISEIIGNKYSDLKQIISFETNEEKKLEIVVKLTLKPNETDKASPGYQEKQGPAQGENWQNLYDFVMMYAGDLAQIKSSTQNTKRDKPSNRDNRDKNNRDVRSSRDNQERRGNRGTRDNRDPQSNRDRRDNRRESQNNGGDNQNNRARGDNRDNRDNRDNNTRGDTNQSPRKDNTNYEGGRGEAKQRGGRSDRQPRQQGQNYDNNQGQQREGVVSRGNNRQNNSDKQ